MTKKRSSREVPSVKFLSFFDNLVVTMKKHIFFLISFVLIFGFSTAKVWAQEYEEVSYDELVQRLSKKKSKIINEQVGASILDDIMIHTGIGLTASSISYQGLSSLNTKQVNGFQLSFGIDLFSQNWASEMLVRNLGGLNEQSQSSDIKSYREFNLRVLYRQPSSNSAPGFRIGGGLGNRYLRVEEPQYAFEDYSPLLVLFSGLDFNLNRHFSLGAELGYRTALAPDTHDKSSLDFLLRMDMFF